MTTITMNQLPGWAFRTTEVSVKGITKWNKFITPFFALIGEIYDPFKQAQAFLPIQTSFKKFQNGLDIVSLLSAVNNILNPDASKPKSNLDLGRDYLGCGAAVMDGVLVALDTGISNLGYLTFCAGKIGNISFFSFVGHMTAKQIVDKAKQGLFICIVAIDAYDFGKKIWNRSGESKQGLANTVSEKMGVDVEKIGLLAAAQEVLLARDNLLTIVGHVTKLWLIVFASQSALILVVGVGAFTNAIGYAQFLLKEAKTQNLRIT